MDFTILNKQIPPPDSEAATRALARWNNIAKPTGSLGQLEDMVVRLAALRSDEDVRLEKRAVLVLCADNGVVAQGIAQTPPEITATMAEFIARGRSSVCCMARMARADVLTVDMGMFRRVDAKGLLDRRIANGTRDISLGAAMTKEQANQAIQEGIDLVRCCKNQGYQILATGEMGIGNTTTSSAIASVLLNRSSDEMTGRGAGLSDAGFKNKKTVIRRAITINKPDPDDAMDVLHKLGGFDIAGMCGIFIGGGLYRMPIVIDGFISAVSALAAARLCPAASSCMFPSHISAEPAASLVLSALGLKPLIDAGMRLGEGTGAVAVLPLLDMALEVYHELMTFADIGM